MSMNVNAIKQCLASISSLLSNLSINPFNLPELHHHLSLYSFSDLETFKFCFQQFHFLCQLGSTDNCFEKIDFLQLLHDDDYLILRSRFSLIICLLVYSQNSRNSNFLKPLWFLLHYRGLSNTGFHLLHKLGIAPCIRSLPSYFRSLESEIQPINMTKSFWWCDNLRRELHGRVQSQNRIDWTVVGRSIVPEPPPLRSLKATGEIFNLFALDKLKNLLLCSDKIDLIGSKTNYYLRPFFSSPLRSIKSLKFRFLEHEVLPISCGSLVGTISLLNYAKEELFSSVRYTIMT
jgi:hypothetical protein